MPAEGHTLVAYRDKRQAGHTQMGPYTFGQPSTSLRDVMPRAKERTDTQLHQRLQRIEKLDPKAKRQITQLLDTFIEHEELKQRVNAQGA